MSASHGKKYQHKFTAFVPYMMLTRTQKYGYNSLQIIIKSDLNAYRNDVSDLIP